MSKRFKKKLLRYFSFFMALNILAEVVSPSVALALTNGSVQPEHIGFEPAGASEMVDLFTGDFKYNIPLMDVDGYPLNLSYHAGANMEQEASWVGLGWSMSPGVLNRNVRGVPDDFKGEVMQSKTHIRPNVSMGVGFHTSTWFNSSFGFENGKVGAQIGLNFGAGLNYNNYKGFGLEIDVDGHLSLSSKLGPAEVNAGGGIGMSLSTQDGGTLTDNYSGGVGVNVGIGQNGVGASASFEKDRSVNTRTGAMTETYGSSVKASAKINGTTLSLGAGVRHSLPAGPIAYSPRITNDFENNGLSGSFKAGFWGSTKFYLEVVPSPPILITKEEGGFQVGFKGMYNTNVLASTSKNLPSYGYLYSEFADYNSLMDYNSYREGMVMEQTPNINLSSHTYDIFSATAQGMGANFRSFRSDVGVMHDPVGYNNGKHKNGQLEVGAFLILHLLIEAGQDKNKTHSGNWDTQLLTSIPFIDRNINDANYRFFEKYYFKEMGEISAREGEAAIGGEAAITPLLTKKGPEFDALSPIATPVRSKRDIRNTYIQCQTAKEASQFGVQPTYELYSAIKQPTVDAGTRLVKPSVTGISRLTKASTDISHHLSEVTVTNNSGERYTYGIPVYTLSKKKVMFNASDRKYDPYTIVSALVNPIYPSQNYANSPMPLSDTYQMVEYDPAVGSSHPDIEENRRGLDNFYQHDITPLHATSYLLTSIVSQDYVDIKGDGPTYDDLGNFTKFNYSPEQNYQWRDPYCFPKGAMPAPGDWNSSGFLSNSSHANYEKGLIADDFDDKAFYEWGTREQYYLHSVETKNYVAYFETSKRWDAVGVTSESGAFADTTSLKLDAIKLYSKSAIIANGGITTGLAPIKTVRFEYDYSLCPSTFNSTYDGTYNPDRGKLTLKKVYFSYGSSEKSALSPYEFTYDPAFNFHYNPRAVDRWGNYKPNSGSQTGGSGTLNNVEYPYTEQDKSLEDSYAAAWCLTSIKTPSGSKIDITYESDDYAYVQNEQAGQMLRLKAVRDYVDPGDDASAYGGNPNIKDANYIVVDLQGLHERGIPVSTYSTLGSANAFAQKNLIRLGSDHMLYYKTFTKLADQSTAFGITKAYWDFISGYAEAEDAGVFTSTVSANTYTAMLDNSTATFYKYAYVKLKKEIAYKSQDVFPITIAGWDFMRNFLPRVAYPGSEPANMGDGSHKPLKMFKNLLVGLGVAKADFVNGLGGAPNKRFYKSNFCAYLDYDKSFVRAFVPLKKKMGGGLRVKKIVTDDNWDLMATPEAKTTYGQTYEYTIMEGKNKISSGVAVYEPFVGGDEISLRQPIEFEIKKQFAPNDHYYQETPYAESMYPAPQVGYSKVTITPLPDPGNLSNPGYCKIGKTEYEFYTAKNFPVIYNTTGVNKQHNGNKPIDDFIAIKKVYKMFAAAQGHVIKLNDMHGKLKAISSYAEDNLAAPISKVAYYYKQSGNADRGSAQLVTSALTIDEKNQIAVKPMSRDIDLSVDVKESITDAETFGDTFLLEIGLKLYTVIVPGIPPTITEDEMPYLKTLSNDAVYGEERYGLNTTSMTKVVQQYGILDRIESFDNKSKTTVQNMLWDKNTGEVVLTKETNHLDQSVYNFNYPAYWPYTPMGHEFQRDNIQILCSSTVTNPIWTPSTGILTQSILGTPSIIKHGDEVRLYTVDASGTPTSNISDPTGSGDNRYWAITNYTSASSPSVNMVLLDKNGVVLDLNSYPTLPAVDYMIKIVKPIEKNNMVAKAGYVTSKASPINSSSISITPSLNIVDAGVQEFCRGSSIYYNNTVMSQSLATAAPNYSSTSFNEIITGFYGTFRPSSTYKYNVDRKYSTSQPTIYSDGYYSTFSPYWVYTTQWGKNITSPSDNRWIRINNAKFYSPHGNLIESENANLVSTSQRQCYNHTLPALTAHNAKGDEVGFDSFEDYTVYTALVTNSTNVQVNDYIGMYKALSGSGSPPALTGTSSISHTGRYSLSFAPSNTLTLETDYMKSLQIPPYNVDQWVNCADYVMDCSKLNLRSKKYLVSMWVKGPPSSSTYTSIVNFTVSGVVTAMSTPTITPMTSTLVNASPIINGWQKLDYEATVTQTLPAMYDNAVVKVQIYSGATSFYIDDLRIQPSNSSMTCNVYDPLSMRLWAQLDERNYATLLEYDSEGMLVRKKKETQKGIYTVQETRKGIVK